MRSIVIACMVWTSAVAFMAGGMPEQAKAGGAWVPKPKEGYIYLGFSRKTADRVWDAKGKEQIIKNAAGLNHQHDFRYGYLNGEVGVAPRVSVTFLTTYLWGLEGFKPNLEKNYGLSDAWFGAKLRIQEGAWPIALKMNLRSPFFYDQDGPYVRHLYNREPYRLPGGGATVADTTFRVINNPEWRGLLRHDLTFAWMLSHSFSMFKGWMNFDAGFTWRQGSPANEIPVNFDIGYGLPINSPTLYVKGGVNWVQSIGKKSPAQSIDRFNFPPTSTYDFNEASMAKFDISLIWAIGSGRWSTEAGYSQWFWGRGARKYKEPFFAIGRAF